MNDIEAGDKFTPIEVMWVQHQGQNFYFATGGLCAAAADKRRVYGRRRLA
jgi:uncharacterized ParB-like nuclease family protein